MTDLSHAIEQLEWLVREDFRMRHGPVYYRGSSQHWSGSQHWWDHPGRREDIAVLRSYIAALRILRREVPAVVIDVPGCTCSERTQEQLDRADVCPACVSYFDLDRWHPEQP